MRKMTFLGLVALTMGLLTTSCIDPITVDPVVEDQIVESNLCTITATLEDATKTSLSGLNVIWQDGDAIKVFNASTPAGEVYEIASGQGTTKATFTGTALTGDGPFYAVYPATAATNYSSSLITLTVPAVQTYAANSFGPGANIAWATSDNQDNFSFKNAGGALKLTLKGDKTIKRINLYSLGAEALSGTIQMNVSTEAVTQVSLSNAVSLNCGAGVALDDDGKDFYIILPKGTLASGFQVEVIDSQEKAMIKTAGAHEENRIARNGILAMPKFPYSQEYNSDFLAFSPRAGAWTGVTYDKTMSCGAAYFEGDPVGDKGQYALLTGANDEYKLRIQNWDLGFAMTMTVPYPLPSVGEEITLAINALGDTGEITGGDKTVKVIKRVGNLLWMLETANGNGYIIQK